MQIQNIVYDSNCAIEDINYDGMYGIENVVYDILALCCLLYSMMAVDA